MVQGRAAPHVAVLLVAGSLGAFLVAGLLCRWPPPHPLSPAAAILTAFTYVSIAMLSGAASTWFFWFPSGMASSVSLSLFTIVSAIGWTWVPTVVLLSRQRSISAVPVAAIAAVVMASGIRKIVPSLTGTTSANLLNGKWKQRELFAAYLDTPPREMDGWIVAISLYGGLFALHRHSLCAGSFLVALCAFLLTWKLMSGGASAWGNRENRLHALLRLAKATSTAVLITTGLLLLGLQRGVSSGAMDYFARDRGSSGRRVPQQQKGVEKSAADFFGYQRIILWPVAEKKKVVAPVLSKTSLSGFNTSKPLTIRFDGSYWYFQPRGRGPGTRAHVARGNPLTVDVRSVNFIPLVMEAHQSLAAAVPLACCREIQVTIENHDNAPGIISLGVLLTDSTSLGKPTLYLDQQTVVSTEPGHFTVKSSPATEVLSFRVPGRPKIQQFDEITVIFFPDSERPNTGAKIAIKQFDLIPR
jgi:hypothetical protein